MKRHDDPDEGRDVRLYEFTKPEKRLAGRAGGKKLYFSCFECEAEAPELAGFLGYGPTYEEICVIEKGERRYPAFLCPACLEKYRERVS